MSGEIGDSLSLALQHYIINRRKFRSQTSDNMDRWKAELGRGREKRKIRRKKSRRERVRRKKMEMREKVGKSRNTVFFQWFGAPEGRKVGSLKRRVRSQLARWEMKSCTPLWREADFQVKMYKTHQLRTTFGSWDVKKVHAVVARSTFPSQNVQNTPVSDHSWKFRCRKSARRCGAKHISKSKCTKLLNFASEGVWLKISVFGKLVSSHVFCASWSCSISELTYLSIWGPTSTTLNLPNMGAVFVGILDWSPYGIPATSHSPNVMSLLTRYCHL